MSRLFSPKRFASTASRSFSARPVTSYSLARKASIRSWVAANARSASTRSCSAAKARSLLAADGSVDHSTVDSQSTFVSKDGSVRGTDGSSSTPSSAPSVVTLPPRYRRSHCCTGTASFARKPPWSTAGPRTTAAAT